MTNPYSQLAAALWFLPDEDLRKLVHYAEQLALKCFSAPMETWTVS